MERKWLEFYRQTKDFKNLKSFLDSGRMSHCFIFSSGDEVSNKYLANLFAMVVNCNNLCFECDDCVKIVNEVHPDVINLGEKTDIMVAEANFVLSKSQEKPMISEKKVFILNNFDRATIQAQNKLLKTIEEPVVNNIYILTTTNINNILPTIKSRGQIINIDKIDKELLFKTFPNLSKIDFYLSKGYLGKLINKNIEENQYFNNIISLLSNLKSSKEVILYSQDFSLNKNEFLLKIGFLQDIFRDIIMFRNNKKEFIFTDVDLISQLYFNYNEKVCLYMIKHLNRIKKQVGFNVNLTYLADNLLMKLLEVKYIYANK